MSSPTITPLFPTVFCEAPHWCSERNELFCPECFKPQHVHKYNPITKVHKKVRLESYGDDTISVVIPVKNKPNEFLVNRTRFLYKLVWDGESESPTELQQFTSVHDELPTATLNDGKCDKDGRFWIGSFVPSKDAVGLLDMQKGKARLFSLEKDLRINIRESGISHSNGITWSLDYKQMYYVDSETYKVDAFDFDLESGNITNRRTIYDLKLTGTVGMPDGMTTDTDGNIWLACFEGSQVICIDPSTGELKRSIKFPVSQVTSCIFGGPNLDILYVTSAKYGEKVKNEEYAGYLFEVTGLGVKGMPSVPFGGSLP